MNTAGPKKPVNFSILKQAMGPGGSILIPVGKLFKNTRTATRILLISKFAWEKFCMPAVRSIIRIESYVASLCLICASAKQWQGKTSGFLHLVAEPMAPWRKKLLGFHNRTPLPKFTFVVEKNDPFHF